MTVLEMIRRSAPRIEKTVNLPLAVQASLQSSFAYVAREAGREDLAKDLARRSVTRADKSGEPDPRVISRQTLAEISLRLGQCPEAIHLFNEADALLASARPRLKPLQLNGYFIARANVKSRCEANPQAAVELYQQAATIQGISSMSAAATAVGLALELARLGRNTEAVQVVERGLSASRQDLEARYFEVALKRILS
ncbi:MAG: hypothetical protein FJW36_20005 [Acidobacteria bacterium]|nr:hypothetical protein [Acidobacteriota bacterium]